MKKLLFLLLVSTFFYAGITAQTRIATIEYQKINREGFTNDLPFPEKTVSGAIRDTLEKLGYKGKETKGFMLYKGVSLSLLGKDQYDLYFSIDRKSRKERETAAVTMLVSKGFDSFITEASDPVLMHNAKEWLDNLRNIVAIYELEQQIAEQEELIKKNEKKTTGLAEDGVDLEKKKKKIEQQIEDNLKMQAEQKKETEIQQQIMETMKAKRRQ